MNWNNYYMEQAGSGANSNNYNVYQGKLFQKGYGLGGHFRRFFNWVKPIFTKHALPALKESSKTLGKEAISSISDISKGIIEGKNLNDAVNTRVSQAISNIKDKVEKKLEGKGIKRSHNNLKKNTIFKKHKKINDIFS